MRFLFSCRSRFPHFPRFPRRRLSLAGLLLPLAFSAPLAHAEAPLLYQQVAARYGLSAEALYAQAVRYSGRQSRFSTTPTPWPWTVRMCRQDQCETVYAPDRDTMEALLVVARRSGLTLYVGPLGWPWTPDSQLPVRAATSPVITVNAVVKQWVAEQERLLVNERTLRTPSSRFARAARAARPARLDTQQVQRWHPLIARIAREEGMNPALLHAVVAAESGYNPEARSPKGAVGLMQLMPTTAERFGLPRTQRTDPERNLRAGSQYLRWLLDYFDQDLTLAVAGYNAGEGAVLKYDHQIPPYPETQAYVRRVQGFLNTLTGGS